MVLFLTAMDTTGEIRDFFYQPGELESGFDFLNALVSWGHVLLKARVMDQHSHIDLPIEAFDGLSCSTAMGQLEQEWTRILGEPEKTAVTPTPARIALARQQLDYYENCIVTYELVITKLTMFLEREQQIKAAQRWTKPLCYHYQALLDSYTTVNVRAHLMRNQLYNSL